MFWQAAGCCPQNTPFLAKNPKKGSFWGYPQKRVKKRVFWPFLGGMSGQVHLILAFFEKNMSLIRGGPPRGVPPWGVLWGSPRGPLKYPPQDPLGGTPPGGYPQDPPSQILGACSWHSYPHRPRNLDHVLDPLGEGRKEVSSIYIEFLTCIHLLFGDL